MQNIDNPQPNPLSSSTPKPSLKIPKNPKIIILIVLGIIILLLLIASLFVRRRPPTPATTPKTPSTTIPSSPTADSATTPIPSQFVNQLDQIDTLLQSAPPIAPPQVNPDIKI